ncbi:MAG TPA: universal stress protein [Kiloniellales bacterium]|nr:universal stress protein [Kiloniellales bacterium]
MALTTMLVQLGRDPDALRRLAVAQTLAKAHRAHLTALYLTRPLTMPAEVVGRGLSRSFLEGEAEDAAESARLLEDSFRAGAEQLGLSHDWIVEDSDNLAALAKHGHTADLIVVSRGTEKTLEDRVRPSVAEELVLVTGLPILVLPPGYAPGEAAVGQRVLIAWKPTREAVRALRDALPILQRAQKIVLATVQPTSEDAISALEVLQYLERQSLRAETIDVPKEAEGVAATLLAVARAHACDLVVSGAYGHARLQEVLLGGGVTRTLFRTAHLPLLLSH